MLPRPVVCFALVVCSLAVPATADPATLYPPINPPGSGVMTSPVALGDVDGDGLPDVVVGDSSGRVHAYKGSNGALLWSFVTGQAMEIDGKPAIGNVDDDPDAEVVVGAGSPLTPNSHGGLYVISHLGTQQCSFPTLDGNDTNAFREGVYSSPALADVDLDDGGKLEILFGAWDRHIRALGDNCAVLWDRNVDDTVWSSPAIADLDGDGDLDLVVGSDASNSQVTVPTGWDGGVVIGYDALTGVMLPGFPIELDEVIASSPAIGGLIPGGNPEFAVGTGICWAVPSCAPNPPGVDPGAGEYLNAFDAAGAPLPNWPVTIAGRHAFGSPALADLDGDGALELIFNSIERANLPGLEGGRVHVLELDGTAPPGTGWPATPTTPSGPGTTVHRGTSSSPVVADVDGDGGLDVVIPSNTELVIWNRNGDQLTRDSFPPAPGAWELIANAEMSTPGVADLDGDGGLEVVGASRDGLIYVWTFPPGTALPAATPWPVFKANAAGTSSAVLPPFLFSDDFESGDTSRWSSSGGG